MSLRSLGLPHCCRVLYEVEGCSKCTIKEENCLPCWTAQLVRALPCYAEAVCSALGHDTCKKPTSACVHKWDKPVSSLFLPPSL